MSAFLAHFGRYLVLAALAAAVVGLAWPDVWFQSGVHNHFVRQAEAFLEGRVALSEYFGDVAIHDGRFYNIFPPFPALLLTPLVAIFGVHTKTSLAGFALAGLSVWLLARVLRALEVERATARWLLAAFFLGTPYLPTLVRSFESWHFAHIVAVACLLAALDESLRRGRGWLIGLWCGFAILSRQVCVYSLIYFVAAIWRRRDSAATRAASLAALSAPLALCLAGYAWFNQARFGDPFDTGYAHLPLSGFLRARVAMHGLFHPVYLPFNLLHMFVQGFSLEFAEPRYLAVRAADPFGTSLTFASPFLVAAVWARWDRVRGWTAGAACLAALLHTALYYNNGWEQVNGQRFVLDFLPVLFVLVALGAGRRDAPWWRGLVVYAVALNAFALFVVPLLARLTRGL